MRLRQLELSLPGFVSDKARSSRAPELPDVPFELEEVEVESEQAAPSAQEPGGPARALPTKAELLGAARNLASVLSKDLGRPVRLYVTDNRSTMLSYKRAEQLLTLRVHHMFLEAPPPVVKAMADYAGRGTRRAGELIDRFIKENSKAIRAAEEGRSPHARLRTRGRTCDLQEIFDRINARHFDGRIRACIGWGRGTGRGRRRTIRMGVYDHLTRTIRIHPALDRPEVPAFFVDYIVFHEMLHQAIPAPATSGRKQHHGPEFRARERAYPDYARALAWERENIGLLLGRASPARARPVD